MNVMQEKGISQVPVFEDGKVVGMITEACLLKRDIQKIKNLKAWEIMEEAPPVVSGDAEIELVKQLLIYSPMVLLQGKGKIIGLITKADLIKALVK